MKKCAYTRETLDVSDFHIDDIIPERLASEPNALESVKNDLGLPDDFDLFGYENLLPCKTRANLQKGPVIFDAAHSRYFLGIASSKKADVEANLERIERRLSRGKVLIMLQQLLERGDLPAADVAKILEDYGDEPEAIFQLLESMEFADASEVYAVAKADIEELRCKPIKLGRNDRIQGVTLTDPAGQQMLVRTCKDYDEAIEAGCYPGTNFDIKMSAFFEHQCGLLALLQVATHPEQSFIAEPRVGVVDLGLLPFSVFPDIEDEPNTGTPDLTYQDMVDTGRLIVKRLRQNMLCVEEPEGMGQSLIEVARADFNGDGIEDILLFEYCYATHGTFGFGSIRILTRRGAKDLFEDAVPPSAK